MQVADPASIKALRRWRLNRLVLFVIGAVILVVYPLFAPLYIHSLMTKVLIFGIFAMSLDLIWGYAGLISLGHAAYFGLGGYGVGILMLHYGISNFWISAPVGILMAAIAAAIFGIVVLRVSGPYFLLITAAIGQLLFSLAWKWRWLSSGGAEGIAGIT